MNPAVLGVIASSRRHSAAETWDITTQVGGWVLSNGDKSADGSHNGAILSVNGQSTGKRYFEITWSVITAFYAGNVRHDAGLQSAAIPASLGSVRGGSAYNRAGNIYVNNASVATYAGLSQGDTILCAVDLDAHKIWYGLNGIWNGDPASGTDPASSALPAVTYKIAAGYEDAGTNHNTYIIRSAASDLLYAKPTGFKLWNDL